MVRGIRWINYLIAEADTILSMDYLACRLLRCT